MTSTDGVHPATGRLDGVNKARDRLDGTPNEYSGLTPQVVVLAGPVVARTVVTTNACLAWAVADSLQAGDTVTAGLRSQSAAASSQRRSTAAEIPI